jgi:uncharacterized membrane protein YcaP (DUF421 family)
MGGVFRAVFGYCFLIFMVRIVGRRPGKQLTPFEFVLIFFMGGVTLTAMIGDDRSLTNALCTIAAVTLMHNFFAWAKHRSATFGRVIDGTPLVLMERDREHGETMKQMAIQDDDLAASARDMGLKRLDQIEYAILERNGEISVIQKSNGS